MKLILGLALFFATTADCAAIDDFSNFIRAKGVTSQFELFKSLKNDPTYGELLSNPVLAPVSFALHKEDVSPRFPRIIMHQRNLTIMTNGDPKKPSSNIFEVITFDPTDSQFKFSLINFGAADPEMRFIKDASHFDFASVKDPSFNKLFECALCHSLNGEKELRPRWGLAPLFQIPFGQANDAIFAGSKQMGSWLEFQKTLKDEERGAIYRYLRIDTRASADGSVYLVTKPNQRLAGDLEVENLRRVGRFLKESKNFKRFEFLLAATLMGLDNTASFLSQAAWSTQLEGFRSTVDPQRPGKELLKAPGNKIIEALESNIYMRNRESVKALLDRVGSNHQDKFDLTGLIYNGRPVSELPEENIISLVLENEKSDLKKIAVIRFLFEDTAKDKTEFWSTHVPFPFGSSYRFSHRFFQELLIREIGPQFLQDHPDLNYFNGKSMSPENLSVPRTAYFELLRARSLKVNP